MSDLPWCIVGDFNDLLANEERFRRVERLQWLIDGFRNTILDCNLSDVDLEDYPFTWSHGREVDNLIEECLDRAMVTPIW